MARQNISNFWDGVARNAINHNFEELYMEYRKSGLNSDEAMKKAIQAAADSTLAREVSEMTRNEMNAIIREQSQNGDLAPEIAQARGEEDTIGERFNSFDTQLAQISKPIVCLTFDDGLTADSLTNSILNDYGLVGNFGLITDMMYSNSRNSLYNYKQYEVEGNEVLSHSSSHINMGDPLDRKTLKYEYENSANRLRSLGFSANGFIVPYSVLNESNIEDAKKVYDYILIGGSGLNGRNDFGNKILTRISQFNQGVQGTKNLIDQAIKERKLLITYDHGIDNSNALSEVEFREICSYLKEKVDAGLIEVHALRNAINKYYGKVTNDRTYFINDRNVIPFNDSWELINSRMSASRAYDNTRERIRITVPPSEEGASCTLKNAYELPIDFYRMGERGSASIALKFSNSEHVNFNKEASVEFLDSSGSIIFSRTFELMSDNVNELTFKFDLFNDSGRNISSITKLRLNFKFAVTTDTTSNQFIDISSIRLVFPNSTYEAPKELVKGIKEISGTGHSISISDFDKIITNPSARAVCRLVPSLIGSEVTFVVQNSGGLEVFPDFNERIRGTTDINKKIRSINVGDTLALICVSSGIWDIKHKMGTWTFD